MLTTPTKYIQFNLSGPWYARWHKLIPFEAEENWTDAKAQDDGQRLLEALAPMLDP